MTSQTIINLYPHFFNKTEKVLAQWQGLEASVFKYSTGVLALRLRNSLGWMTLLPFQGQQIWHIEFYDRLLTMQSMFAEPNPTTDYLRTYGGFLIHCGATAMGGPGPTDTHPVHGELPNATYQTAQLVLGKDDTGAYIGLTGSFQYSVAFNTNYIARPLVKLYENSSKISISMEIENLRPYDMELMYLGHVNFRPVDHGRLVYTAPYDADHVRVRAEIPAHLNPPAGYREFLAELKADPTKHHRLSPDLAFNPEAVFYIDYSADSAGWAHSMQIHPNGGADFISHRPDQLDHGIRWLSRTGDQDALGLILPATAEPEGYTTEKAKGNIKSIPAGDTFRFELKVGALTPDKAREMEGRIDGIMGRSGS